MTTSPPRHDATEVLAAFATALRAAGVPVTADRSRSFLAAVAAVGADDPAAVFWAGRATLCGSLDDLDRYDQVFGAWFGTAPNAVPGSPPVTLGQPRAPIGTDDSDRPDDDDQDVVRVVASSVEVLRRRDIAQLTAEERTSLIALFSRLQPQVPFRRSPRRRPSRRGEVDVRRTLRAVLRNAGEPAVVRYRARSSRPRRIVVLVDVSGSMGGYVDSLLRLAHAITMADRQQTEVFTLGTRLTRVTRAMRLRDGESALIAAAATVPDWSGGTRLGESLQAFLDRWGQRGMARGAVVVVMSDGWERGDAALLRTQMDRLHRLAHRVIWSNPHQGKPGYAPVQAGIVAALPFVDDLVAGHSMAAFERVLEVVADA